MHLRSAEAVLRYAAGVLDGRPAVTRHPVGTGIAWYVSTRLKDADLLDTVLGEASVRPVHDGLPPGVEVVRRVAADRSRLFVLNHTPAAHDVAADAVDLLSGAAVTGHVRVPAGAAAVIRCQPVTEDDSRPPTT